MTKPPLHNIDSLFQQKLEELPVDISQQQAQWQALNQAMHQQPSVIGSQLHKPWLKGLYMTLVALAPFGVFYLLHQPSGVEVKGSRYTENIVTKSLLVLNNVSRPTQTGKTSIQEQVSIVLLTSKPARVETLPPLIDKEVKAINSQPEKGKDSVRTTPVKQEKPVIKKADSSYIYWQ